MVGCKDQLATGWSVDVQMDRQTISREYFSSNIKSNFMNFFCGLNKTLTPG